MALRTADAEAAARELQARGIPVDEPIRISRPVDTPDGRADAGFVVALIAGEATPATTMFLCQHLTPEHVWLPELRRHPNTAEQLDSVTVLVDDPAAVVEPYAALFGAGGVSTSADGFVTVVTGGAAPIRFVGPAALAARCRGMDLAGSVPPAIVGLGVRVRNLTAARVCLDDAGIVPAAVDGGYCVAPREACGVLLKFCG